MIAVNIMAIDFKALSLESTLASALELFTDGARVVPVIDKSAKLLGVVTLASFFKAINSSTPPAPHEGETLPDLPDLIGKLDGLDERKVGEYISDDFKVVRPETKAIEIANIFANSEPPPEGVMVVDDLGMLVGVITPADIFKRYCEYSGLTEYKAKKD